MNSETIEIEKSDIAIESNIDTSINSNNNIDIEVLNPDYSVYANKKQYVITGDDIYIPSRYEDSPQWLRDIISTVTDFTLNQKLAEINALSNSLSGLIEELEIAKNTYTQSIISSADIDSRINTAITTLNSTMLESDATLVDLLSTKATPTEASSLALNVLTSSIDSGAIKSIVSNLQNAISTTNSTLSNNIDIIHSEMTGEFEGTADAISGLQTFIGIDNNGVENGTGLSSDVRILQKQNDGVIETVTGTYDVMIGIEDPNNNTDNDQLDTTKEPYATWKATDVLNGGITSRSSHVGDVYIKYTNSQEGYKTYDKAYKFIKTEPDSSSPYSTDTEGFTWAAITDTDAQNAYIAALNALDLADSKRRLFVGLGISSTPTTPYDSGDVWLIDVSRTVNGISCKVGDILRSIHLRTKSENYNEQDWILASSYQNAINLEAAALESWKNNTYSVFTSSIQNQVDKKSEIFYQNSIPSGRIKAVNCQNNDTLNSYIGDIWKNTYSGTISGQQIDNVQFSYIGNNTEYVYTKISNGSNFDYSWTEMQVPDIVFDTIDTKKSIYSGNSIPVAVAPDVIEINDMWITGSNVVNGYDNESIYVWNGSIWTKPLNYTDDTAVTTLQTGLADGTTTIKLTNAFVGEIPLATYLKDEIDNRIGIYSGESEPISEHPTGVSDNDIYLWFTTANKVLANGTTQVYDITRTYKYTGSEWSEITTDNNITALADLADGKRTVFSGNTVPVGAVARDIWIPSATNGSYLKGEIYQYNGTDWIIATKYTEDLDNFVSNTYEPSIDGIQSQIDGQVNYYFYTSSTGQTNESISGSESWNTDVLKKEHHGDISYDKTTNTGYYYDRLISSWIVIDSTKNAGIIEALKVASVAQSTADNKISHYYGVYQNAIPITNGTYKYWLTFDKILKKLNGTNWDIISDIKAGDIVTVWDSDVNDTFVYYWSGSMWVSQVPGGVTASSKSFTEINASLESLGTAVEGHSTQLSEVNGNISAEGARVESKWSYNSSVTLNGVSYSSGFGMATNITHPGQGIPVGQSEFWVNSDVLKVYDPINGKSTLITAGKINTDLIELKTEEAGYSFTIDKTGIKIVQDGIVRLLIGKIS